MFHTALPRRTTRLFPVCSVFCRPTPPPTLVWGRLEPPHAAWRQRSCRPAPSVARSWRHWRVPEGMITSYRQRVQPKHHKRCDRFKSDWRNHNKCRVKIVKCVVSGISACYRTTLQHLRSLLIRSPQKEAHRFRVNFPTRHGGTPHAFSSLLSHSPNVNQSPGRFTAAISTPDAPKTRQRDKETVTQKSESGSLNQTWYAHMHA